MKIMTISRTSAALIALCVSLSGQTISSALNGPITVSGTASVAGAVIAEGGSPVSGAIVTLTAIPATNPPNANFQPINKSAPAGQDGSFSLTSLPAGTYRLCAQMPRASGLLDPCLWTTTPTVVTLATGQAAQKQTITMPKGRLLKLHIDDPGGLIAQNEGKTPGAGMIVGIGGPVNIFTPFFVDGTSSTGRDQSILVPYNTPLKIVVHSSFYSMADAGGKAVPTSSTTPITIATTDPDAAIGFQITGVQSTAIQNTGVQPK